MVGLLILLAFNLAGVWAHDYLAVPLPGNVIGLLLLLAGLMSGAVKMKWVEGSAGFLLKHMMMLFAPVIVGVLGMTRMLAAGWLPLVATMVVSTLVTLAITAAVASLFKEKREHPHD